jgi:hypothetical protein
MNAILRFVMTGACLAAIMPFSSTAQVTLLQDYQNYNSAPIGTYQGINFREAGFSALFPIAGTDGKEFWTCSDRGVNIDCASANPSGCRPTYDKMFIFPNYAPKIHRIKIAGDSIQILRTITMKRPGGANASGVLNPTGFGSTAAELVSTDTVQDCASFNSKTAAKDIWAIDPEGIVVDKDGNFYVSEENGPTIWKLDQNGVVVKRYSPYANLAGAQPQDVLIDTVFRYRKNNRGFESMAITPNGKIYALIQSPILYPTTSVGENTRIHRLLEIDPATNAMRMLVYLNDGIVGASGPNQIRLRDWKTGDMAAINDSTFLVLEAALRGTTDVRKIYKINISNATPVNSGLYGGQTLEALVDSAGLAFQGIAAVRKTLAIDLNANGWPSALEKAEGLAIINDSTIAVCNDNDFGQVSPAANGIATATGNLSHLFKYRLQGSNKLTNFEPLTTTISQGQTALNSSHPPYLTPTIPGVQYTAILTAGDVVNGYKMAGTPDGLGAFDNNNGTFTLLMNHEFGNTAGIARAHGSTGTFVSKWVINKSDFSVVSGADLIQTVKLWNTGTSSYNTYSAATPSPLAALGRFCSADLAPVTAFYNPATGKGTTERIFLNGEETGPEGRAFGHIATGASAGTSYELMALGKASFENQVASPTISDTTVVIGLDDATPGQVYVYVGTKTNTGTDIDKAGLNNGRLYGVAVAGLLTETGASVPAPNTVFTLADLGNVQNLSGSTINANSINAGVTNFLRPEDGAWDPSNLNDFYFATTNGIGNPSRLWKLHFTNVANPLAGGTITAVLEGNEGQQMLDNITIDHSGHVLMVEDVGSNVHIGKIWQYDIATDAMTQIARHDTTRFLNGSANFLTQDEEASGILDVQEILGPGMFICDDQAHYGVAGEQVEGGQLFVFNNPVTAGSNPEMNLTGNSTGIEDGDMTPTLTDNTDFGNVNVGLTKVDSFVIENTGSGNLSVSSIRLMGGNDDEFSLQGTHTFPMVIPAGSSQTIAIAFTPAATGARNTVLYIANNDYSESVYNVALKGNAAMPEINVKGNNINIIDGDATPGTANNTDFGTVNNAGSVTKSFVIQNTGAGNLTVSAINVTGTNAGEFTLVTAPAFPLNIAESDSQTVSLKFSPVATGLRTATLTIINDDADEPEYNFAIQGRSENPTGIDKTNGMSSFVKLYPNPAKDEAIISMTLKHDDHVVVHVFDIEGKKVMQVVDKKMKAGEQQISLNTSGLASGAYFVEIATGSQSMKVKMVVAR